MRPVLTRASANVCRLPAALHDCDHASLGALPQILLGAHDSHRYSASLWWHSPCINLLDLLSSVSAQRACAFCRRGTAPTTTLKSSAPGAPSTPSTPADLYFSCMCRAQELSHHYPLLLDTWRALKGERNVLPGSGAVPSHSSRRSALATTPRGASDPFLPF